MRISDWSSDVCSSDLKDKAFDDALMQIQGKLSSEKIRVAAERARVDWQRLENDMKAHRKEIDTALARSDSQAGMIRIRGTPAMFIGPYLVSGALPPDQRRPAVAMHGKSTRLHSSHSCATR